MKDLMELWAAGESPIENGIMFPGDSIRRVNCHPQPRPAGRLHLAPGMDESPLVIQGDNITFLVELFRIELIDKRLLISGGEGGMGADGFIAVTDLSNSLKWMAFFDFSNPFVSAEIFEENLEVENNLGEIWRMPIVEPSWVEIETFSEPGRKK